METTGKLVNVTQDLLSGKMNLTFEVDNTVLPQVEGIKDEKLSIKAVKYRAKRSLNANATMWHCIGQIAAELQADKWEIYLQMLKRYGKFTYICVKENAVEAVRTQWRETEVVGEITINGQKAVQLLCYYGSSLLNTKEFSVLLDGIISEMREMGLDTPTSEDIRRTLEEWEKNFGKR